MSKDLDSFKEFMKKREEAAKAYVNGDPKLLGNLAAREDPTTFFSPKGDYKQGAGKVSATYESDVASFDKGSETHFEILHMSASDGIAYWVGFQKAIVRMHGKAEAVPFDLRITEIYRREGGEWKMIHRHADPLKSE